MLTVRNLTKTFGNYKALDQLSFTIQPGSILGLIGQNGAGKTTTFRLILDFIQADMGTVLWNGQPIGEADYNRIGYLPEERGLYPKLTIEEQLLFFAELRGKSRKEIAPQIDDWLDRFQVKGKKTDKVQTLSKGNQQKVQLIATLIHQPKLVILDEPFSGLDPVNAQIMKNAIIQLRQANACVIFSSHNMDNVEQICDQLIMLKNGKTVLKGNVQEIRESFGRSRLYLEGDYSSYHFEEMPGVEKVEVRSAHLTVLHLSDPEIGKEIFRVVTKDGYIPMFNQQPPTLEEIFKMKAGAENE